LSDIPTNVSVATCEKEHDSWRVLELIGKMAAAK
jgi:hypothetical protein